MTPEQIKTAVDAAIGSKIILTYSQMIIFLILVGFSSFFGAYLKKKGENLATADDVKKLTEKTEEIKTIYTKQIEDYKSELTRRERIAKVAEFFTEWQLGNNAHKTKLNGYATELSLWLPSDLYRKLASCVCYKAGAPSPKEILIDIRKNLLADDAGDLKPDELIKF